MKVLPAPATNHLSRAERAHPYWFVVLSSVLTVLAIFGLHRLATERDEARFRNGTETVEDDIVERLDAYISILQSTRSLFVSQHGKVDLPMFRSFVSGLDVEARYPGLQGVGFSLRMNPGEVEGDIERIVRDGQVPFRLWPDEPREKYQAIVFLEPLDARNRAALGFDMMTEPVRQEAMARARDTGKAAASGRVTLIQEIDPQKQSGFLIYVPVYRGDRVPPTVEERREKLLGFVYSPFRVDDLMRGIFGSQHEPRVAFDLYDGAVASDAGLMHRGIGPDVTRPNHSAVVHLDIAGRPWTLRVVSTPGFDDTSTDRLLPYLVVLGALVNAAYYFTTRAQVRAQREESAAHRRLAILAEISKRLSEARLELPVVLKTVCDEVANRLTSSCMLMVLNAEGTHLELAETMPGHPSPEGCALLAHEQIPIGEPPFGQVAATGEPFEGPNLLVVPLRLGDRIIGTLSCSRVRDDDAFTEMDQHLLQEIADRAAFAIENARLADRLQLAVGLRDDFLSVAGHELKTPLAALQLQIEALLRQAENGADGAPKRLVDRLAKVRNLVARLEVLLGGLLDVSRIAAGNLSLHNEEVDLTVLLSDIIDRFSEHLRRAGCKVSLEANARVFGQWDKNRLDQVFTNIVSNAFKYGRGKPIEITISQDPDHARVSVHDHGIGVAPEDRARIFGRFERAVCERSYGGLGLGLWISQQIVGALGGRIEVESELGVGSTFIVELPLATS